MSATVFLLVFDGFADWEPALACAELNKSGRFPVRVVGYSMKSVTSMGGLEVVPQLSIEHIAEADATLLIVPGGDHWETSGGEEITPLLQRFALAGVPIAVICGATIAAARAGLLDDRTHTSNFAGYLDRHAPTYRGQRLYRDVPAVLDRGVLTASGMGSVEFAFEIIKLLALYNPADLELWLRIYRDKVVPPELIA